MSMAGQPETASACRRRGAPKIRSSILPDADPEITTQIVTDSVFGNAGQRCLAASLVVTVGSEAQNRFTSALVDAARSRVVGYGLEDGVEMGPVITPESKARIAGIVEQGVLEGAKLLLDGRQAEVTGYEGGNYLRPTILADVPRQGEIFRTEIFGPVMGLMHVDSVNEAIELVNSGDYGNMACLFTSSGSAARQFRQPRRSGQYRHKHRRGRANGFFPLQRLER